MFNNPRSDKTQELIALCKLGNRKAQFELYNLYAKAMFNTCLRIVREKEEAEDALQESFLEAFTKLDYFRGESTFGAWLKSIVVNKALNKLRLRKIIFEDIDNYHNDFEINEERDFFEDHTNFAVEKIKSAINSLPDGFRIVLNLYLFEGYDHHEISQILGISESTSRSQYIRGKSKLLGLIKSKVEKQ